MNKAKQSINLPILTQGKSIVSLSQKHMNGSFALVKDHGIKIISEGQSFYKELWSLSKESAQELKNLVLSRHEDAKPAKKAKRGKKKVQPAAAEA